MPVVSVVIPVLDEEAVLGELHRRVRAALADIPHELVFVDDGSTAVSYTHLTLPTILLV